MLGNTITSIIVQLLLLITLIDDLSAEKTICESLLSSIHSNNQTHTQIIIEELELKRHSCMLELFPRYFWAQNMSHILVKFQFLNSADTSACQQVLSTQKTVEHNTISLSLICLQSGLVIRYHIAVTTLMPLNFYHAHWREEQNTIILECLKSPNPYFWKTLYLPSKQPPRKPRVWWSMVQKYMENTKKFIYDLQVEEEETDVSTYVKSSRKARKGRRAGEADPHSKKHIYCNQNNPFELGSWLF